MNVHNETTTDIEKKLVDTNGEREGQISRYKLLHIKQISNKNILHSTGNVQPLCCYNFFFFFCLFCLFQGRSHSIWRFPGQGVESELQPPTYARATATTDPSPTEQGQGSKLQPLTIRRCCELRCRMQTRLGSRIAVALAQQLPFDPQPGNLHMARERPKEIAKR